MVTAKAKAKARKKAEAVLLDPTVIQVLSETLPGFDRAGFLEALLGFWGGMDRFAEDVYGEFRKAPPGSQIRQRILQMVLVSISQQSAHDADVMDVELLDDTQLRKQILRILPELTKAEEEEESQGDSQETMFHGQA